MNVWLESKLNKTCYGNLRIGFLTPGGLAHSNPIMVSLVAKRCLHLWDLGTPGCNHRQSMRFLSKDYRSCQGEGDVGLRTAVELLASGLEVHEIPNDLKFHFIHQVGSLKLVIWLCRDKVGIKVRVTFGVLLLAVARYAMSVTSRSRAQTCFKTSLGAKVRIVERTIEGCHSLLANRLKRAPAAKPAYLSWEMRSSLLKPALSEMSLRPEASLLASWIMHFAICM